jgi:hypothetical protein
MQGTLLMCFYLVPVTKLALYNSSVWPLCSEELLWRLSLFPMRYGV